MKSQGVVLVTVMLFLVLTAAICLSLLQNGLVEAKMGNSLYRNNYSFTAAETALLKAEEAANKDAALTDDLTIADKPDNWLKKGRIIRLKGFQVRFALTKLQTVCFKFQNKESIFDFFHITVWLLPQFDDLPLFIESIYSKPAAARLPLPPCIEQMPVKPGRQSWLFH